MSSLDAIFITHLHGDHCFGLFGLLSTLGMGMSRTRPLTIVGPIGIRQLVVTVMRASQSLPQYDLTFIELEGNGPCDLGTVVGGTHPARPRRALFRMKAIFFTLIATAAFRAPYRRHHHCGRPA